LEMDFVLQGDARSMHVLNAVSPAWTCTLPFAKYVCDEVESLHRSPASGRNPAPAPCAAA